ncbi:hypothetical protein VCHA51O444_10693 [Vibrio chagasii]|nr:hypothetical protein VCHA51O444_10693 [Vibrio chagasii]
MLRLKGVATFGNSMPLYVGLCFWVPWVGVIYLAVMKSFHA